MAFATIGTAGIQAQSIDLSSKVTGTLPVPNGGLGIASGTTGQFLKFTGTETLASATAGGGKVLNVVSERRQGYNMQSTSTSFVDIDNSDGSVWETSITPSATSSKILLMAQLVFFVNSNSTEARGSYKVFQKVGSGSYSEIEGYNNLMGTYNYDGSGVAMGSMNTTVRLITTNTTDAVTFKFQFASLGSNQCRWNDNDVDSNCTLMEISS